jgi:hypothetical protein
MNHKIYTAIITTALGLGIYIGKSYYSATETKEVQVERVKNNIVTVVKEVVRPDGTKETNTTITDTSTEKKNSTTTSRDVQAIAAWHVSASYAVQPLSGSYAPVYGVQVERRILGPFSVGVRLQSDKQIGIVVAYEF